MLVNVSQSHGVVDFESYVRVLTAYAPTSDDKFA